MAVLSQFFASLWHWKSNYDGQVWVHVFDTCYFRNFYFYFAVTIWPAIWPVKMENRSHHLVN